MQSPRDQLARADRLQAAIAVLQQEIQLLETTGEVAPPGEASHALSSQDQDGRILVL